MATRSTRARRNYRANSNLRKQVPARMKRIVKELGGTTKFARRHQLDPDYVYRWTTEGMVPSVDNLLRLARISKVNPTWVLLGKGTPYLNGRKPTNAKAAA